MKEVAPGIFMITEKENGRFVKFAVNVYVIADSEGLIFDAGYGRKKTIRYLIDCLTEIKIIMMQRGIKTDINRILPSHGHWDHFSGITRLKEKTGIRVLSTERMMKKIGSKKIYRNSFRRSTEIINVPVSALKRIWYKIGHAIIDELYLKTFGVKFIKCPVEIIAEDAIISTGERRWEVIYLPGHCDDHIVLYNRKEGILLAGDMLLRTVTTWLGPPRSNLADYIKSLEFLLALPELKLILPAHGSPIPEPRHRIQEAISHRKKRTDELLDLIRKKGDTGITFNQIFHTYYPKVRLQEKLILRGWILTTLEYLNEKALITGSIEGNSKTFRGI